MADERLIQVKSTRDNVILIPANRVILIEEGERQTNYIHVDGMSQPVETTCSMAWIKQQFKDYDQKKES